MTVLLKGHDFVITPAIFPGPMIARFDLTLH